MNIFSLKLWQLARALRQLSVTLILVYLVGAILGMLTGAAHAQTTLDINPPDIKPVDHVGVLLVSGLPQFSQTPVSIGPTTLPLAQMLTFDSTASAIGHGIDNNYGGVFWTTKIAYCTNQAACPVTTVMLGRSGENFYLDGGVYYSQRKKGSTLVKNADGSYTYTQGNGTRYRTDPTFSAYGNYFTEIVYPDGHIVSLRFASTSFSDVPGNVFTSYRLQSVTRNDGYQLLYTYASNTSGPQWHAVANVVGVNNAVNYCDPAVSTCSLTQQWPTATYTNGGAPFPYELKLTSVYPELYITDAGGQVTKYAQAFVAIYLAFRITGVKEPTSASSYTRTYSYSDYVSCVGDGSGGVGLSPAQACSVRPLLLASVDTVNGTWRYSYQHLNPGPVSADPELTLYHWWYTTGTGPEGYEAYAAFNDVWTANYVSVVRSGISSAQFSGDYANRISTATDSQGRNFSFSYDDRGNTIEKRQIATSGSGLSDAVITAGYDAVCTNPLTCNQPNWVKDANLNQANLGPEYRTDFTYDPAHGGVLTITSPPSDPIPPATVGIRPQKRYSYVQRFAWVKNAANGYVRASSPIWVLSQVSSCQSGPPNSSGSTCVLPGDEVITSYDYGPDSGPNNLLLRGQVVTAAGQNHRTCYGYDTVGNKISETTPNAGLTSCP